MASKTTKRFSPEVRARAVRLVLEHEKDHSSRWAAVSSIAAKIGCTAQSLQWVDQEGGDRQRRAWRHPDRNCRTFEGAGAQEPGASPGESDLAQGVGLFRPGGARPPIQPMIAFIDDHRQAYGVEPICRVLPDRPVDLSRPCRQTR